MHKAEKPLWNVKKEVPGTEKESNPPTPPSLRSLKKCYWGSISNINDFRTHFVSTGRKEVVRGILNGEHVQLVCCNSNLLSGGAAEYSQTLLFGKIWAKVGKTIFIFGPFFDPGMNTIYYLINTVYSNIYNSVHINTKSQQLTTKCFVNGFLKYTTLNVFTHLNQVED